MSASSIKAPSITETPTLVFELLAGALKDKGAAGGEREAMSASSIKALIIALPQYRELLSRLSVHIALSSDLK